MTTARTWNTGGGTAPPQRAEGPEPGLQFRRFAYHLAHGARRRWYTAAYALTNRMSRPRRAAAAQDPDHRTSGPMPSAEAILTDLDALFRMDFDNIEAGHYRMPHDLWGRPGRWMRDTARYFREVPVIDRRRRADRGPVEVREDPGAAVRDTGGLPRYYLRNFHFQTDGYLSDHSADLYDYQVNVLFGGGADAMRRQALVPLSQYLRDRSIADSPMADVATGTGRFLTYVKDNYPRLPTYGLDLSVPYLRHARRLVRPWSRLQLVQGAAEALPFADGGLAAVTCIYLLHELPRKVRHRAIAEMVRVVRPGGRIILVDSIQYGDHPPFDPLIDAFPRAFHEPFYADYARDDVEAVFLAAGCRPVWSRRAYLSRIWAFNRPA